MVQPKLLSLAVLFSVLLVGCSGPTPRKLDCPIPNVDNSTSPSLPLNITLHIHGSGSMLGYVNHANSRYIQTIDLLRRIFPDKNHNYTISYYRSGTGDQKIDYTKLLRAKLPEFYNGTNTDFPGVTSNIVAMIDPPEKDKDELVVILTDLYQNGADATALANKIQEFYLNDNNKDYAVGVIGIKSEFNGKIYLDKNHQLETFHYNTDDPDKNTPEQFRPFYILLIGPYSQVNNYFNELKTEGKEAFGENSKWLIFSPNHFMEKVANFQDTTDNHKYIPPDKIISKESLNDGSIIVQKDTKLIEFLQLKSSQDKVKAQYSLNFRQTNYTSPLNNEDIDRTIKVQKSDKASKNWVESEDRKALDIEPSGIKFEPSKNQMNLTTSIDPAQLTEPGIYYFKVDLTAKRISEEDWWKEWNSTDQEHEGSKTDNVKEFLLSLQKITTDLMKKNPPLLGRFCYAVQK